jgi:hypothetical protein
VQADGNPVATARADLVGQASVMVLAALLVLHAARSVGRAPARRGARDRLLG